MSEVCMSHQKKKNFFLIEKLHRSAQAQGLALYCSHIGGQVHNGAKINKDSQGDWSNLEKPQQWHLIINSYATLLANSVKEQSIEMNTIEKVKQV